MQIVTCRLAPWCIYRPCQHAEEHEPIKHVSYDTTGRYEHRDPLKTCTTQTNWCKHAGINTICQ